MCGLAGIVYPSPRPIDGDTIERLFALLEHRGPDDQGWLALGPAGLEQGQTSPAGLTAQVVLVSRRLSILDLSEAGRQPMSSADGRFHLVYNGEIYNYVELRRELEALGHRFTSGTDTEVLLAGYFEWGPAALQRLVGMFAFAVLDVEDRSLFLARDFFGMKPLYYARVTGGVAFSSEIAPLLELPGVGRDVNPQRLYDFLRFDHTDYGGQTFFADVAELPPASCASVSLDRPIALEPVRYWSALTDERLDLSFDEAAAALRDLFLEGLDQHLRSDVSLGASLSGGVESSAIVMGMRALRGPELDLRTFSYVADEPSLNEELWIDAVAGAAGASTAKIGMTPRDFGADFDRVLEVQGEPFVELPVYAEYRVFGLAKKEGLSVILSGQGGDELFGGYSFFLAARLASLVRRGRLVQAARFAAQLRKLPRVRRVSDVVRSEGLLLPRAIRELLRPIGDEPLFPWWLDRDWFLERGVRPRPPVQAEGREALREKLHLSLTETAPLPLVGPAPGALLLAVRHRADRPLPGVRLLLGGAEGRPARALRTLAARPRPGALRCRARGAGRAAADCRGPWGPSPPPCSDCATSWGCPGCPCCSSGSSPRRCSQRPRRRQPPRAPDHLHGHARQATPCAAGTNRCPPTGARWWTPPGRTRTRDVWWDLIALSFGSVARVAIVQAQDVLGLGAEARMNTPGTAQGAWQWRLDALPSADLAARLREVTATAGRLP